MLSAFKNALAAVKDGALEAAAKVYANDKIKNFGCVTNLRIDTGQKKIFIEAALQGEASLISVTIGNYDLTQSAEGSYIALGEISSSREWVGTALNEYLAGKKLRIPPALKAAL
jgi:hypothetical protein